MNPLIELIKNDTLIINNKYNKVLNRIGKKPLSYNYSYEKTRLLLTSLSSETKTLCLYHIKKRYPSIKLNDLQYAFSLSDIQYRRIIKNIKKNGLVEEYKILYEPLSILLYEKYLIK